MACILIELWDVFDFEFLTTVSVDVAFVAA